MAKCRECNGTGIAEYIGGYARPCEACFGKGETMVNEQPEFDCAAKAEREGQPKPFTLIASDPLAPWLVRMWAAMSQGDVIDALGNFYGMVDVCSTRYVENPRAYNKINSAEDIAMNMHNWRIEKGLK